MAPVAVKEIAGFSSEDSRFPADNILTGQKWLINSKDTSGRAVLELNLDKVSRIHYIDVGYNNASSLEISVARSTSAQNYSVILPRVMLQTPAEGRAGKNKVGCRMFNFPDHLNGDLANKRWDRIRIILEQRFSKNKQIGLEFVRLASPRNTDACKSSDDAQVASNSSAQDTGWRSSPLARLAQPVSSKNSELRHLESKLLKISGTTEDGSNEHQTLSRTAKMVLSSRSGSLPQNLPENHTPNTPTSNRKKMANLKLLSPKYDKKKKLYSSSPTSSKTDVSPKTPKQQISKGNPTFQDLSINSLKSTERTRLAFNTSQFPKSGTGQKIRSQNNEHANISARMSSSPQLVKVNGGAKCISRSIDESCSTDPVETAVRVIEKDANIGSSSAKNQIEGEFLEGSFGESQEKNGLSKSEIKKIKKQIQQFFNSLYIDAIDPDNITLKDLRTAFEATYDVQLDKSGRQYFRTVTADFLELAMTVRLHKQKDKISQTSTTPKRKRKSPEKSFVSGETVQNSPKVLRLSEDVAGSSSDLDCQILSVQNNGVQCPLCMEYFPEAIIASHAAVCGEEEIPHDLGSVDSDVQITSVTSPPRRQTFPGETFLDLSDNMRLSEEEKRKWTEFARKPKPYHPRMTNDHFRGHQLIKCPTCGQFYKSEEIEEHSEECADKVYSGLEKRGLYYVRKDESIVKNAR